LLIISRPLKFPRFQDETPSESFKSFYEDSQIMINDIKVIKNIQTVNNYIRIVNYSIL
jgi:hypothetical protein